MQRLSFDSNLFGFQVGRIDVRSEAEEEALALREAITAAASGYRLVYVSFPPREPSALPFCDHTESTSESCFGSLVDLKTSLTLSLAALHTHAHRHALCGAALLREDLRILRADAHTHPSRALLDLAVAAGVYSRFNVDPRVPREGVRAMFERWLENSLSRTAADEVFVAVHRESGEEVGFITVKAHTQTRSVSIGLLAVNTNHRRKGIASALLSRAALWAMELRMDGGEALSLTVVTQGANREALSCYERFGFRRESVQAVRHVWLPEDIPETHALVVDNEKHSGPESVSMSVPVCIPFCKPHLTGRESEMLSQLLHTTPGSHSGLQSEGVFHRLCTERIQSLLGERCTCALLTPSGTAALELAAILCDLQAGDEVIMPSFTFPSTANAFVLRGAVPVFVDVRADTLNIDETLIEAAITPRTRAICVVHYAGVPCKMDTICMIAHRHGLKVIEDAAQGFLSTYKGRPVGSIGDFGCFSFHHTKNVVCGEGGALSVNNSHTVTERARVVYEKGTNRHDFVQGKIDNYLWMDLGSSFVPSELCCAVLWAQLQDAENVMARRRAHYEMYRAGLSALEEKRRLRCCALPSECVSNAHIFFVLFDSEETRRRYQRGLSAAGIEALSHFLPLHSSPAGQRFARTGSAMHVTDSVHNSLLRLPIWADLTVQQIEFVIETMKNLAASCDEI